MGYIQMDVHKKRANNTHKRLNGMYESFDSKNADKEKFPVLYDFLESATKPFVDTSKGRFTLEDFSLLDSLVKELEIFTDEEDIFFEIYYYPEIEYSSEAPPYYRIFIKDGVSSKEYPKMIDYSEQFSNLSFVRGQTFHSLEDMIRTIKLYGYTVYKEV